MKSEGIFITVIGIGFVFFHDKILNFMFYTLIISLNVEVCKAYLSQFCLSLRASPGQRTGLCTAFFGSLDFLTAQAPRRLTKSRILLVRRFLQNGREDKCCFRLVLFFCRCRGIERFCSYLVSDLQERSCRENSLSNIPADRCIGSLERRSYVCL